MKKLFTTLTFLVTVFLVASCSEEVQTSLGEKSITQIAKASSNLTIFAKALELTGLEATFDAEGNSTVFAPTDDAFESLFTEMNVENVEEINVKILANILKYHVVANASVLSSSLQNNQVVTTLLGENVTVSILDGEVSIVDVNSRASIVGARDVKCSNGIIHVIDTVLLPKTIATVASLNPNLSIFLAALEKAGLTSVFTSPGNYTVFAPTNDQFEAFLVANGFADLDAVPNDLLDKVLKNHVLKGAFYSTDLTTNYYKTLALGDASATNTLSMFINNSSGIILNGGISNGGSTVTTTFDVEASNGVIHLINNVMGLPNIVNHAIANPDFTSLVGALTSPGQPDFVSTLSGTGPFTVFAPNNAAFTSLDTELAPGGIAGVSVENLTKVLNYHVVSPANVLSTSLTQGQVITPILSPAQTFTVLLNGGARIKDANNRECNIVATDVQASNGVIHVLSKVLLPTL